MVRHRSSAPRISIGLPVYNGERYLAAAVDCLLAQSFGDFELIICDNASTDASAEIARDYAARDERVQYHPSPRNIGAAPNFNRAFRLARGELFKWAAGDDLCAPEFLERCVQVLDRDPGVVLAYPRARIIDEASRPIEPYELKLETDSPRPSRRFNALLKGHKCFEVFGLIRHGALARTPLIGAYSHGDGVLLARLAFLGRFEEVPEYLFFPRRHAEQSMAMLGDYQSYAAWFDPQLANKTVFPYWRIYYEFFRSVNSAPLPLTERLRCYRRLAYWAFRRRRRLRGDLSFHWNRLVRRYLPWAAGSARDSKS